VNVEVWESPTTGVAYSPWVKFAAPAATNWESYLQ
jgi:hypothetical protein